jgi:hypothetical protein
VAVRHHDDGSSDGMYDLKATLTSGDLVALEVTQAADEEQTEFWKVYGAQRWTDPGLAGGWRVRAQPTARLKSALPAFLLALEQAGLSEYRARDRAPSLTVDAPPGLERALQWPTGFPGSIYAAPVVATNEMVGYAAPTAEALAGWIGDFLADARRADVRRKLAGSGAAQRHAFAIVPGSSGVPFSVLELLLRDDPPLPEEAPDLPPEVSDVWIVSSWDSGVGFRWSSAEATWRPFSKQL